MLYEFEKLLISSTFIYFHSLQNSQLGDPPACDTVRGSDPPPALLEAQRPLGRPLVLEWRLSPPRLPGVLQMTSSFTLRSCGSFSIYCSLSLNYLFVCIILFSPGVSNCLLFLVKYICMRFSVKASCEAHE